jgi:hypothetical protein
MIAECCRSDDVSQYTGENAAAVLDKSSLTPNFAKMISTPSGTSSDKFGAGRAAWN